MAIKTLAFFLSSYTLAQIADAISADWEKVYFGAAPYLEAMHSIEQVDLHGAVYGADSGTSVVAYFLANASTWRGVTASVIKAELNRRLKASRQR